MSVRAVLLVVAALVVACPPALAQVNPPSVSFPDVSRGAPLAPETASWTATLRIEVGCNEADLVGAPTTQPTVVNFTLADVPAYAQVTLALASSSKVYNATACLPQSTHTKNYTNDLTVVLDRAAPAQEPFKFQVRATVDKPNVPNQNTLYGPYSSNVTLMADYAPGMTYTVDRSALEVASGATGAFAITMTNRANGPTVVTTTVTDRVKGLVSIKPPNATKLESTATEGASARTNATVPLEVVAPSVKGDTMFLLDVHLHAKHDAQAPGNASDMQMLTLSVRVKAAPKSPDVAGPVVLASAALALLLRRRRL